MLSLFLIPVLLFFAVLFIYRFSGKKEFLQMDLVQFIFAFVIYPIGYIWLKNFLYVLLRAEIGEALTLGNWVAIDTAFTIVFLYFYAFGIIHALTKTFSLNLNRDPLYDMFEDSKYFHEFLSHVGMYVLIIVVALIISILNGVFPFLIENNKNIFRLIIGLGGFTGFLVYIGAFYATDKGVQYSRYRRIMKLTFGVCFLTQVFFYYFFRPTLTLPHSGFWFVASMLSATILSMFIFNPTRRFGKLLAKLPINGID